MIIPELVSSTISHNREIFGITLEMYAYLELVSRGTFNSLPGSDGFLPSSISRVLDLVGNFDTCGFLFGIGFDLFNLFPRVCDLRQNRLMQRTEVECSDQTVVQYYQELEQTIRSWQPPRDPLVDKDPEDQSMDLVMVAQMYQQAMLIFLHASFHTATSELDVLQAKIAGIIPEMFCVLRILSSTVSTTMIWPLMMVGSFLRDSAIQEELRIMFRKDPSRSRISRLAVQLLEWVWDDESAFGLSGLDAMVKHHAVDFCFT
ncbi:hypothetical protein LTR84_008262 [Exophiala bonariae]|uniref:Uncharacterized protein n=1 Tax=Exophiala bonariae TaxID=1690606 RepID=A0AAV9MXY5_9EURO|nr:hypothetical protein LTR84_008262 [Exophiala bonariae]